MMDSSWILLQVQLMPQKGSLGPRVGDPVSGFMAVLLWSVSLRRGAGKSLGRHRIQACLPKASSVRNHEARITACWHQAERNDKHFRDNWHLRAGSITLRSWGVCPRDCPLTPLQGLMFWEIKVRFPLPAWLNGELRVWRDFKNN